MPVGGVLATHYHPDHVGGSMMGHTIEGVAGLLERVACPVHVQRDEAPWVPGPPGVAETELVAHDAGDASPSATIDIELVHTPGHTPGSQCFLVDGRLVSGDTLFLEGCGRTDLPGSDPEQMYDSLQRLASLPDDTDRVPRPPLLDAVERLDGGDPRAELRLPPALQGAVDDDVRQRDARSTGPTRPHQRGCRSETRRRSRCETDRARCRVSRPRESAAHQVSMFGRFLPARGSGSPAASSTAVIQRRVSAGSMTSSISK